MSHEPSARATMSSVEAPIGARVKVSAGTGHVRWTGANPKFAAGKWVGIELLEPSGKNDGSVQGERYFSCSPKHGVFVRPSQVQILELPSRPPSTRPAAAPSTRTTSPLKPSASTASTGYSTPARRISSTSTATQNASPPQPPGTRKVSSTSASAPNAPLSQTPKRPPSVAEAWAARRATTPSSPDHAIDDAKAMPPPPVPFKQSTVPSPPKPLRPTLNARSPPSVLAGSAEPSPAPSPFSPEPNASARASTPDHEAIVASFAQKRELDELRIKVRILESRRSEDQERIKSLESKAGEADALRAARVKLQAKFQELQSSLVAAQRASKDLQSENRHLESRTAEVNDQLEMAALDREVAEERAEAAETDLERATERIAELELEIALLKEENAEYEKPVEGVEGGRSSLAYIQLEKHNERLKEALIRLRDVSSETEREYKTKVADLEKELALLEDIVGRYELSEAKLANAEAQVEDLKLQLDDALGAEDMLEQLTECNFQMGERIEEMRITIEDLEALKELNDELEEGHVETEKQLNQEIDQLSALLQDERARSNELDAVVLDMESTLDQFRDLTASLQSEIDDLRLQQATRENESVTTSQEAQAIMNLNLKLQSSAVKAQSKTIDLELKRLETAHLAEQMKIVTAYLPDPYHETEADSTTLLLFFRRIGSKVETLISAISAVHGLPASLQSATSEALVGVCELRGKLRAFSTLNRRFSGIMTRSGPEEWVEFGKILTETTGVETRVDGWISQLKNGEFNEGDCARDLGALIAQFEHLANTSFHCPELCVGEQQLGLAYAFDYDLDNFAAAVGFARQAVLGLANEGEVEVDVGESSMEEGVYEPVQRILDLVRTVKNPAGKLISEVEAIAACDSALPPATTATLSALNSSVSNAVDLAVHLAQRIGAHVASLRTSKAALRLVDIKRFLDEVIAKGGLAIDAPPWETIASLVQRLGAEIGEILPKLKSALKTGQVVSLAVEPPWLARVATIKEAASYNADTERKVVTLSEQLKDMLREIKMRDQTLQESGVKVETLERRLEAARKQADQIVELENDVAKAKKQEKVYEDAIEQLQKDLDLLEAENAKLNKGERTVAGGPSGPSGAPGAELAAAAAAHVDGGHSSEQVENLRSAIRFLRRENALLKGKDLYRDLQLLPPLSHVSLPVTDNLPDLVPSSPGSFSSDDEDGPMTPSKHTLAMESKLLWNEVSKWSSTPHIVDISKVDARGWTRRKGGPEEQAWIWRAQEKELGRRVNRLKERTLALGRLAQGLLY